MPLPNSRRSLETMSRSRYYRGQMAEESRCMKLIPTFSPSGLKVLVVDDDPLCLMVHERMLRQCDYKVTTCGCVSQAIAMVTENKDRFDLVLCDVCLPEAEGFRLLEIVGLGFDLPVIMMSANGETSLVMQGITHGACDYLIKPLRIEELGNIWQHVVRRRGRGYLKEELGECEDREVTESPEMISKKRKDTDSVDYFEGTVIDDISSLKKARVHWTVQLHHQFVGAVNQLGIDKAVPKKIAEIMRVQGLSRENVASHLQKYRLYLKRLSGSIPEPYPVASFQAGEGSISGGAMHIEPWGKGVSSSTVVKGLNLGGGVDPSLGIGRGIDQGTLKSLQQYRAYEQKLAANRAQVLGSIGISPPKSSNIVNMPNLNRRSKAGLQRMNSVDMGLLWNAQCEQDTEVNQKPRTSMADHLAPQRFKNVTTMEDLKVDVNPVCLTFRPPGSTPHSSSRHSRTQSMFDVSTAFPGTMPATNFQNNCPDKDVLLEVDELNPMEDIAWITSSIEDEKARTAATSAVIFDNFSQDFESTSVSPAATDQVTKQAFASAGYEASKEVNVGSEDFFSTGLTDIPDNLVDDFMPQPG